jgi:hypothetical protein
MNPPPTEPDLTFHWPVEKGFPFVLFVCVAGSLLAHTATFFLFQVVYSQRVTIPQPAPHVSLLTPSSPENLALLRWIEAEDPALVASNDSVPPPGLVEVRYHPSFATPRTAPLGAPPEKAQENLFPRAIDRLIAGDSTPASTAPPLPPSSTVVRFVGALAPRPLMQNPPVDASQRTASPVTPSILLIGVNAQGEIRYESLQQSSGDTALDELAAMHLRRLRFAPSEAPITWGHVIFAWGADVYAGTAGE